MFTIFFPQLFFPLKKKLESAPKIRVGRLTGIKTNNFLGLMKLYLRVLFIVIKRNVIFLKE